MALATIPLLGIIKGRSGKCLTMTQIFQSTSVTVSKVQGARILQPAKQKGSQALLRPQSSNHSKSSAISERIMNNNHEEGNAINDDPFPLDYIMEDVDSEIGDLVFVDAREELIFEDDEDHLQGGQPDGEHEGSSMHEIVDVPTIMDENIND